jgi:hypothetical protein
MDIREIRRQNLAILIAEADGIPELARRSDANETYLRQILSGFQGEKDKSPRKVGDQLARKLEIGMSKPVGWMDITHQGAEAAANDEFPSDKYKMVPRLNVRAAAGHGHAPEHVEVQSTLAFQRAWLGKKGLNPDNLEVYEAVGESMAPHINNGDVLLVDVSETTPKSNELWVIWQDAPLGVRVKRLFVRENGDVIIRSDNPDRALYPDEIVTGATADTIKTMGKVVWRGG